MRGRKPTPTRLKILTGNPGKRRINGAEPKPTLDISPPDFLDVEAKREWNRIAPELKRLGLLTGLDRAALTAYCQAWSALIRATKDLKKKRTYTTTNGAIVPHPAVAEQRNAWKTLKEFATLFGLDPSSRSRLQLPAPSDENDALDQFLA